MAGTTCYISGRSLSATLDPATDLLDQPRTHSAKKSTRTGLPVDPSIARFWNSYGTLALFVRAFITLLAPPEITNVQVST